MLASIVLCWHNMPAHFAYYYAGIFDANLTWPDLFFSADVIASISAHIKILQAINSAPIKNSGLAMRD